MNDGNPPEIQDLLDRIRSLSAQLREITKAQELPPEQVLVKRLGTALFGRDWKPSTTDTAMRFLFKGPVGNAFNLFVSAIMSKSVVSDRQAVMTVVQNAGWCLEFAAPGLRNDKEIVLAAMPGGGFPFASEFLKSNKDFVLDVLNQGHISLGDVSAELRDDIDIVLKAVARYGDNLQFASSRLRDNPEIVLVAIRDRAPAFRHAGLTVRGNKDVMLMAIKCEGFLDQDSIIYAAEDLQHDLDVIEATREKRAWKEPHQREFERFH